MARICSGALPQQAPMTLTPRLRDIIYPLCTRTDSRSNAFDSDFPGER